MNLVFDEKTTYFSTEGELIQSGLNLIEVYKKNKPFRVKGYTQWLNPLPQTVIYFDTIAQEFEILIAKEETVMRKGFAVIANHPDANPEHLQVYLTEAQAKRAAYGELTSVVECEVHYKIMKDV